MLLKPHDQPDIDQIEHRAENAKAKNETRASDNSNQNGWSEGPKPLRNSNRESLPAKSSPCKDHLAKQARHECVLQKGRVACAIMRPKLGERTATELRRRRQRP